MKNLCLFVALLYVGVVGAEEGQDTLSIDLGGTRVKAAIFPKELTWEKLKEIKTYSFSSKEWLSEKLPELLVKSPNNPLSNLIDTPGRTVVISVSGPVFRGGEYIDTYNRGVPFQLRRECEKRAHNRVDIENDTVTWVQGYMTYKKLKDEEIVYPSLVVVIGTGLGVAVLENQTTLHKIETSFIPCPFHRLKEMTKRQFDEVAYDRWKARYTLGKAYFDWLFKEESFDEERMRPYLTEYNQRFEVFIEELLEWVEQAIGIKVKGLVVGGGYSRFICPSKKIPLKIDLESPIILEREGISPDLIQLLGYDAKEREKLHVEFHPPLDDVLKYYFAYSQKKKA